MNPLEDARKLAEKAKDLAGEHADQLKAGIEKAEGLANKATGGRYPERIEGVGDKARAFIDGLEHKDR